MAFGHRTPNETGRLRRKPQIMLGHDVDAYQAAAWLFSGFVGLVVVRFSRNYLDGDADHGRFTKWLCFTLASVLVLILSGNMVQFAIAWLATSLGLNRLLLFYRGRPAAIPASINSKVAGRREAMSSAPSVFCR